MKCLETRRKDGMKWRRYRTTDGRIVTTYELPTQVLRGVTTMTRLRERLAKYESGQKSEARRARAKALLAAGWKAVAVANELGVQTRSIERLRAKGLGPNGPSILNETKLP